MRAASLPEPGGKVLARSIGRNPVWERDSPGSPPVEDRFRLLLTYRSGRALTIEVNPWGAYRVEQGGDPVTADVLVGAAVAGEAWDVELAVPMGLVGKPVGARLERIRSRRPLAPEFRWAWPGPEGEASLELPATENAARPALNPPLLGNREAPMEVGRSLTIPPLGAEWDSPAWQAIPAFHLLRNDPQPRAARYPTEVRWVQDGRTLALMVRASEPEPVIARAGGRDSAVAADDHVAIHLATSGSAFLEFDINSVGAK